MNIYRTVSLKKFVISFVFSFFGLCLIYLQGDYKTTDFNMPLVLALLELGMLGFLAISGMSHAAYLLPQTVGYKYFRSIPDAYEKFKKYSVFCTSLFSAIGLAMLIPLAMSGFGSFTFTALPVVYFIVLGLFHITSSFKPKITNFGTLQTMIGAGAFGGSITLVDNVGDTSLPSAAGVIAFSIAAVFVIISIITFYTRLNKNWYGR